MRIFCMTTGAGRDDNDLENLVIALSHSIHHYKPDKIIFFGSKNSEGMIKKIRQVCESHKKPINDTNFIELSNIDSLTDCFNDICEIITAHHDDEIIMDYTSGTKSMVAALCMAGLLHRKKLTLTSGKRDATGKVRPGTTKVVEQPLYDAYDKIYFENVKRDFNTYRFDSALDSLKEIVIRNGKPDFENIINGYKKWDLMEWDDAYDLLKNINPDKFLSERFRNNKQFLGTLVSLKNRTNPEKKRERDTIRNPKEPYIMILADLLNNAHRRINEGKYDDAVSRLYRATELISQIMLFEKGIDEINDRIYFSDIEKHVKNPSDLLKYEERIDKQDTGGLRKDMGVRAKFQLLKDMGDERGWKRYSTLRSDMEKRNQSILAHGLRPVGYETAKVFQESVVEFSYDIFGREKMEDLIEKSKFPIL